MRLALMLLLPVALISGALTVVQPPSMGATASAQSQNPSQVVPPSGLQITPLDSSLHVTWSPSTDPATMWHVVSVWDGPILQQAKVVGRTGSAAQANGLVTGQTYTVRVQAMDTNGSLSSPVEMQSAPEAQQPMPNVAFFDNFNDAPHGAMDPNYYDVRTTELADPDDSSASVEQRQVFVSERHWHTMLLMGHGNGSVYVRPRVPFDISGGREGTLQFEMDFPPVQASHGKWAEFNFVKTPPKDGNEFGVDGGDSHEDSFNFSLLNGPIRNGQFSFNQARITYNFGGESARIAGTGHFYSPANVRLPVVIKLSKTSAKIYINGQLAAQVSGFTIPWDTGWWIFPQINYSPAKAEHMSDDYGAPPILAAQLIHWETIQFDGPAGSYNPVVKTYIQPGCPGTVNVGRNSIVNCPRVYAPYSYPFTIGGGVSASQIRSARLLFNGSGAITARINGNQFSASGGSEWDALQMVDLDPAWFADGLNTFSLLSGSAAQIEVEVVYNVQRTIGNPPADLLPMISSVIPNTPGMTNQSVRIEKLTGQPNIQSRTVYLYSQGSALPVAYSAQVLTPSTPWLTVSPAAGVLTSPALGGGVVPIDLTVDFTNLVTSNEGSVGIVKVTGVGAHMPVYIAVLAVNDGDSEDLNYITSFSPMITTFNRGAIPGYGGGYQSPTPTPTGTRTSIATQSTTPPAATSTPTSIPTSVLTNTPTPAGPPPATATAVTSPPGAYVTVFDEGLSAGWQNWSWGSSTNLQDGGYSRSGSVSASCAYITPWGALFFGHGGFSTAGYEDLVFYINGGTSSGRNIDVRLVDASGAFLPGRGLNAYIDGGSVAANAWRRVTVPLGALGGYNTTITGIVLQDGGGLLQPRFYIDDMQLVGSGLSTPTSTPTSEPTATSTPTSTPTTEPITPIPTSTPTSTPTTEPITPIPTSTPTTEPTYTSTPTPTTEPITPTPTAAAVLIGHVTWEGRDAQPSGGQQLPLTLTLKSVYTEVNYPQVTTDPSGFFTVPVGALPQGVYAWRVKGPHGVLGTNTGPGFLANGGQLTLTGAPVAQVEMGLMLAGDADNDNVVDSADWSILMSSYGLSSGDPGFDARADFTGDGTVDTYDLLLQHENYSRTGAPPLP